MKLYTIMFVALTSFGAMAQATETEASTCKDKAVKVECQSKETSKCKSEAKESCKKDAAEHKECKKGAEADKKCCKKDGADKKECKKGAEADKKCCKKDGATAAKKECKTDGAEKKDCKKDDAAEKKCCKKDGAEKKECKKGDSHEAKSCHKGGEMSVERRMEVRVEVNDGDTTITINGEPHEGAMSDLHWTAKPLAAHMHQAAKPMLGVAFNADAEGATISQVIPGSTAQVLGLQAGDIITKVNKTNITDHKSAVEAVGSHDNSQPIVIRYTRDGKKAKVQGFLIPLSSGMPHMKIHQLRSPEGEEQRVIIKKVVRDED